MWVTKQLLILINWSIITTSFRNGVLQNSHGNHLEKHFVYALSFTDKIFKNIRTKNGSRVSLFNFNK